MFAAPPPPFGGWQEPILVPGPPPITAVRIPADGTPPHLVFLPRIPNCWAITGGNDHFLPEIPDMRPYWPGNGWRHRSNIRLDFLRDRHIPRDLLIQQQTDMWRYLYYNDIHKMIRFRQRYLAPQRYLVLRYQHQHHAGGYYLFHSVANELPHNAHIPTWISYIPGVNACTGDAFLVKMLRREHDESGLAYYADISPDFLDVLAEGPIDSFGWRN